MLCVCVCACVRKCVFMSASGCWVGIVSAALSWGGWGYRAVWDKANEGRTDGEERSEGRKGNEAEMGERKPSGNGAGRVKDVSRWSPRKSGCCLGDRNQERQRSVSSLRGKSQRGWGMEGESTSLSSTAELSDLVCYQQELTGARAKITEALFTHIPREMHTHT